MQAIPSQAAASNPSPSDNGGASFTARKERFLRIGYITCVVFLLLIIASSTIIRINSAVTATGKVVQTGENKDVQHPTGGPVGEILVKNGDLVEQGQPVIIIDGAQVKSQYQLNHQRQFESHVAIARLNAMVNGASEFRFDDSDWAAQIKRYPDIVATQEALFKAQLASSEANINRLETRLRGLKVEEQTLQQQSATINEQLVFIEESLSDVSELYQQQLVEKTRLTQLRRERVSTLAQLDSLRLQVQQARNAQSETVRELESARVSIREDAWLEIDNEKALKLEAQKMLQSLSDQQARLVISAPASGRVHELKIRNIDAVVSPGEVIMQIVPVSAGPTISTRVKPIDIEQVYPEQEVRVRLDSFSMQTTPELIGTVSRISPDSTVDAQTGEVYFDVIVDLSAEEIAKVTAGDVIPGLPVTTMFTTGSRTIFNYLVKPLSDQLFTAFREE